MKRDPGAFSSKLKTSILGAVMTSYRPREKSSVMTSRFGRKILSPVFSAISAKIASSRTTSVLAGAAKLFLSLKLKVYGTFLASFGIYTAVFFGAKNFVLSDARRVGDVIFGLALALASIPLAASDETLSSALLSSRFGAMILRVTGQRREAVKTERALGRANHGFLFGLAAGIVGYFTSPVTVLLVISFIALFWIISSSPEFGIAAVAAAFPFATEGVLTALLAATLISHLIKFVRGKRFISFETADVAPLGLTVLFLFSAIVPHDPSSGSVALKLSLFMLAYFAAANLTRGVARAAYASSAAVFGMSAASFIVTAVTASSYFGIRPYDGMLGATLVGERITLADPSAFNMATAAVFPIALAHFIKPPRGVSRAESGSALALLALPVVLSRSFGAAAVILIASMAVLLVYSTRFIWLPVGAAGALGAVCLIFPAVRGWIVSSLSSNLSGFAGLRTHAWSDAADVISRSFFGGAGFGTDAFTRVSDAATRGALTTGHVYNTYLQTWIEVGIVGVALFLLFGWHLATSSLSLYDRLDLVKGSWAMKIFAAGKGGADKFAESFALSRRMAAAGPACGVFALMLYAFGDHIFADSRIFLLFWLIAGVAAGAVRSARAEADDLAAGDDTSLDIDVGADETEA